MGIGDQFSNLLPKTRAPTEDERLLQLFRNRAELKKEFIGLQDERHELLEKLKKQEIATQRAKEQLHQLETYLGNPEVGQQALTFFQLRALWQLCAARLMQFGTELKTQQEERERRRQLAEFDQQRRRRLAEADRQLLELQSTAATLESRLQELSTQVAALRGFWHYFKRRKLAEQVAAARSAWDAAATLVTDASDQRALVESEPVPVFNGVSTEGRRLVNTTLIAYAQQLAAQLSEGGLATQAKETTVRRVYDVQYGTREQCLKLMMQVRAALQTLAGDERNLLELKERTDKLRARVTYRSDADTVPQSDSIGSTFAGAARFALDGTSADVNVLVDDYWNLYEALLP